MPDEQFKEGDVVQLKSGGPVMTIELIIEEYGGRPKARCIWFEGKKKDVGVFELHTLTHAE